MFQVHFHLNTQVNPGKAGYGDEHPRFGYPNSENDVPELREFLATLFDIGYLKPNSAGDPPWVGIEVKPVGEERSDLVLAHTKRSWRRAWAQLA